MRSGRLTYDGTTYRLDASAVADLLARGIIVPDPMNRDQFELVASHLIEEVEPFALFDGFRAGDDARGERPIEGKRRLIVATHRDGQGP